MARRQHFSMLLVGVMLFLGLTYLMSASSSSDQSPFAMSGTGADKSWSHSDAHGGSKHDSGVPNSILTGGSIASKLENATAKAELGRASWKLFHTMMARFPEKPSDDDSLALKTYIQLFARLYPCGDCASHFQKLLKKFPPQTGSRNNAVGWACMVHNKVNKRLKKPEFDCNNIGDFYDCGCGDEDKEGKGTAGGKAEDEAGHKSHKRADISLVREEGLTRGG
ncbi:ERV/ALR sulfhydryl oxidase domain-containing protein [Lasiosphaeria miniovina]|uniref:Sulfhydryl oxidase n=1 Tax=Lasiosphaeria miniovina TaxID=1954250 RepID=A0AA40ABN8_9PEZI|nr:ERV/ALR sulfhydryl oxidase domain-containing protein [Lasiosphaeria miniovina]KAK0712913.1 ERV/ALR sulfhydryl oxidase domain-containing protein [Lasiosphaeria miniovina]